MTVRTYKLSHDWGFAPNPFGPACTLATCKPNIRKASRLGDFVFGTAGAARKETRGRAIYWMKVDEIATFDEYWRDERFRSKRPVINGGLRRFVGDNIYHRPPGAENFVQAHSFHSLTGGATSDVDLRTDTSRTDKVLIGREFAYWGCSGPELPGDLRQFICNCRDMRRFSDDQAAPLIAWLRSLPDRGWCADPTEWTYWRRG